jgi:hypothetical protein
MALPAAQNLPVPTRAGETLLRDKLIDDKNYIRKNGRACMKCAMGSGNHGGGAVEPV